ncbi:MAG: cell division protein ZapB [Pseudomonadota bacterium]
MWKLDNEILDNKFNDIEEKVDFLIELCQTLQQENAELMSRVESLKLELDKKNETEERYVEQQAVIRSKIDGLLSKINTFTDAT